MPFRNKLQNHYRYQHHEYFRTKKLAKKLIAVLGKEDAIELLKYLQDHPTDKKHKVSDLLAILETSSENKFRIILIVV